VSPAPPRPGQRPSRPGRQAARRAATPPGRRRRTDRGSASVQLVIAVPALMLCLLFIVQAAVWWHATHIAQAAATRAADAARVDGGSAAAGERAGRRTATVLGADVLRDPHVTVARQEDQTRAEVRGVALAVAPGARWPVRAVAVAPTERFLPPPDAPPVTPE